MQYEHTQFGKLMFLIFLSVSILSIIIYFIEDAKNSVLILLFIVLIILASFLTLKVTIDSQKIRLKFGYGLFFKNFKVNQITSAKAVKNRWFYGWGIRYWFRPRMWIFNVSGFDAVEIIMQNGDIYRIGTNDPIGLEKAIKKAIKK